MNTTTLEAKPVHPATPPPRGHVLVVDDEEQNRMLLRDSLEAHGYEIAEAADGEQALQQIAERPPDVVLLDVMMPRMDGFEVCRRLKNNPATAGIPVLMVTALSERKERMMGVAAGANDFLNKPVDIQDLTLRVRNAAQLRRLFAQLQQEQEKSERLLRNILPPAIAERMKRGETHFAEHHPEVTVLVADLVGFTELSAHISPDQVVSLLNEIFCAFDEVVARQGLEKIKTIGDAYMVAGGLTQPRADHAEAVAGLALALRAEVERINREYSTSIRVRMGISTGPVVAGVIGRKKISYDLWGDSVNLAFGLEAAGEPGTITVSGATFERVKHSHRFQRREGVPVKGHGAVTVYQLLGRI
ncbi:MAG TPA: adenylate/guanylate cyclase domain-containing protein [Verrucomicrobiae bacterium]|nr:adenylate/guanylate cyclase domain-containing protein [Verrucomicrobiae bacterium]